jgi:hypothetical protein
MHDFSSAVSGLDRGLLMGIEELDLEQIAVSTAHGTVCSGSIRQTVGSRSSPYAKPELPTAAYPCGGSANLPWTLVSPPAS